MQTLSVRQTRKASANNDNLTYSTMTHSQARMVDTNAFLSVSIFCYDAPWRYHCVRSRRGISLPRSKNCFGWRIHGFRSGSKSLRVKSYSSSLYHTASRERRAPVYFKRRQGGCSCRAVQLYSEESAVGVLRCTAENALSRHPQDVVYAYNHTVQRSTHMRPVDADDEVSAIEARMSLLHED